jgi:hypothetical protein
MTSKIFTVSLFSISGRQIVKSQKPSHSRETIKVKKHKMVLNANLGPPNLPMVYKIKTGTI